MRFEVLISLWLLTLIGPICQLKGVEGSPFYEKNYDYDYKDKIDADIEVDPGNVPEKLSDEGNLPTFSEVPINVGTTAQGQEKTSAASLSKEEFKYSRKIESRSNKGSQCDPNFRAKINYNKECLNMEINSNSHNGGSKDGKKDMLTPATMSDEEKTHPALNYTTISPPKSVKRPPNAFGRKGEGVHRGNKPTPHTKTIHGGGSQTETNDDNEESLKDQSHAGVLRHVRLNNKESDKAKQTDEEENPNVVEERKIVSSRKSDTDVESNPKKFQHAEFEDRTVLNTEIPSYYTRREDYSKAIEDNNENVSPFLKSEKRI